MSIQWTLVACFLYFEIALVILLLLPFISATIWQKLFKSKILQGISRQANIYFYIFIGILVLFFLDSIRDMHRYSQEKESEGEHGHMTAEMQYSVRLFRSQRNFYISGFALFLWLVIRRLVTLISNQASLNLNYIASMKQAKSASDTAERLLKEKEENRQTHDEEIENIGNNQRDAQAKRITELEEQLESMSSQNSSMEKKVEAMKRQSESTSQEYDRLMGEHARLQNELKLAHGAGDNKKDE